MPDSGIEAIVLPHFRDLDHVPLATKSLPAMALGAVGAPSASKIENVKLGDTMSAVSMGQQNDENGGLNAGTRGKMQGEELDG